MSKDVERGIWRLFRSTDHLTQLWSQVEAFDGELPPNLEKSLDDAQEKDEQIRVEVVEGLKDLEAIIEIHARELTRLRERKIILEGRFERLKTWLSTTLKPGEKWSNGKHTLCWRTSTSVEANIEKLSYDYLRVSYEADKAKLKESLAAGIVIEGARLVTKQNFQIK
jgi:hypothetical protein